MAPAPRARSDLPKPDALFVSFQSAVAGRYSLEREIGRGGMGVVYLAREVRLDRAVAIKLLPPEFAAQSTLRDRFLREARTAARLSHPYIVPIHSVDEAGEFVFYVMAYVDGETLGERVAARGPLAPAVATRIMREVAWALAYAHAQGVVHRDVKPANILLEDGTERAMVTDFGIARLTEGGGETAVGELLGTPEYMSPEQAGGDPLDGRSDLYALGAVGFFAVTGEPPFAAPTTQAVLAQQISKPARPVSTVARGLPASLSRVIDSCLEKDPSARYPTGEALADALAPTLDRRAEIPVPVRVFLDRRRMAVLVAPAAMAFPLGAAFVAAMAEHNVGNARVGGVVVLTLLALSTPVAVVVARLRTILRLGYGPDDIAAALRVTYERHREEFHYAHGVERGWRETALTIVGRVGLALGAVGLVLTFAPPLGAISSWFGPLTFVSLYFGGMAAVLSTKWRRLHTGAGPKWAELWQGRMGRTLSRIAGFKLGARAIPANRPTELAIAMSAEALFKSFPKETRESLGDVPSVLRALEAHAQEARARIAEADAALAEAQRGVDRPGSADRKERVVAELTEARSRAEARLADVVTTLENVRLDLLRLRAGATAAEGITQDLIAARALSDGADRLLAGAREAEEAIPRRE